MNSPSVFPSSPRRGFAQKVEVRADSPPREEGWPRHKKKGPVPKTARTGWSLRHPFSKPILEMELVSDHPVCGASVASHLFIDAAASPPHEEGNVPSICDFLCKASWEYHRLERGET